MSRNPAVVFPFCAVVGQETAKKALLLHAVNPRVGGVLLCGGTGTAKSILIRSFIELIPQRKRLDIPLHLTEDRLLGGLDSDFAVRTGERRLNPGLLAEADGQVVAIDEANLLPENLLRPILQAAERGWYPIEREGLSEIRPSRFLLFATFNPEAGELSRALLDHAGLYVRVEAFQDTADRMEIIRRRIAFEREPEGFVRRYETVRLSMIEKIERSRRNLPFIHIDESMLRLAAEISREAGCSGHRAEIRLLETARAIASWENDTVVRQEHVEEAAGYILPHRMRSPEEALNPPSGEDKQRTDHRDESGPDPIMEDWEKRGSSDREQQPMQQGDNGCESESGQEHSIEGSQAKTIVESIGRHYDVRHFAFGPSLTIRQGMSGKRNKSGPGSRTGRYVKAIAPRGKAGDLAFDATFRAAAPFQRIRRERLASNGEPKRSLGVIIEQGDLREKVRESRSGTALLFVVDASGSMNAAKRMKAVKGAMLSLLRDAYRQRDVVGLIAFRGTEAEMLLDMTRSVELAERKLELIQTGGKTPLSAGLRKGAETLHAMLRKKNGFVPAMVVITDGKANTSMETGLDPWQECRNIARQIAKSGLQALVIDTEEGYVRLGLAQKLAEDLHAQYFRLAELEAGHIEQAVRRLL